MFSSCRWCSTCIFTCGLWRFFAFYNLKMLSKKFFFEPLGIDELIASIDWNTALKGVSDLLSWVMSLPQQLPKSSAFYRCGMNNLYISPKFTIFCNNSGRRIMIHGVCYQGRAIPQCIMQERVTNKENLLGSKGAI